MYFILSLQKLKKRRKVNLEEMDKPQPLSAHEKAIDAVYMNGSNKSGDNLIVGTARRKDNLIDGFLFLRLQKFNSGILESIKIPGTALKQTESEKDQYAAEGIKLSPIIPMKKWKLEYNGQLKETLNKDKVYQVKIDAEFTSDLPIFNFDVDMDNWSLAKSISYEKFSRDYFKILEASHQTHYEQHGNLHGFAEIDGEKYEINLDTVRDHSFGVYRDWRMFYRYVLHFFTTENGDRFMVSKICAPITFSRLSMGYVCTAEEKKIVPITWTDFELFQHGEGGLPPNDYAFLVKSADGIEYTVQVQATDSAHVYISKDWEAKVVENLCNFKVNGVNAWGCAEWEYRNNKGKDVPDYDTKLDPYSSNT